MTSSGVSNQMPKVVGSIASHKSVRAVSGPLWPGQLFGLHQIRRGCPDERSLVVARQLLKVIRYRVKVIRYRVKVIRSKARWAPTQGPLGTDQKTRWANADGNCLWHGLQRPPRGAEHYHLFFSSPRTKKENWMQNQRNIPTHQHQSFLIRAIQSLTSLNSSL